MSPLEIESRNTRPMLTAIYRTPGGRFETGGVENFRITRINRDVVNVAVTIERLSPCLAAIIRNKNPSAVSVHPGGSCPRGQIQTVRRTRVNGQTIRSVYASGERHFLPGLGAILRTVQCAVAIVSDAAIFRSPSHN